jgi:hypothetical protein
MQNIRLTKTFIIDKSDKDEVSNLVYEFLTNEILLKKNEILGDNDSSLFDFIKNSNQYHTFKIEKLINALKTFIDNKGLNNHFYIKSRNYQSFYTYLEYIMIIRNEVDKSFHFILFFDSASAYYVCSIDSSIVVSFGYKDSEAFHIDMSDPSISISKIVGLYS